MRIGAALAIAFAAATLGCSEGPSGPDFSGVGFDLSHGDASLDLSIADVYCAQTCVKPAACCITPTLEGGWEAMCADSCPDGGVFTQCTGPGDCSVPTADCCVSINLSGDDASIMSSGGGASCTADCPGGLSNGNSLFNTKLCHTTTDCSGYSGDFGTGAEPFDGCCQSPRAPALRFCAPSRLSGSDGLSCN